MHYLSAIEDVAGDYLEFGVFTGSSFCHSIRCSKKLSYLNPSVLKTRFFGFDSFSGFGEVSDEDQHSFYTDENFDTDFNKVNLGCVRLLRIPALSWCQVISLILYHRDRVDLA